MSAIVTANGIRVFPDRNTTDWPEEGRLSTFSDKRPADALNLSLQVMTERYGGTHDQCRCHVARISAVQLGPITPSARQQFRLIKIFVGLCRKTRRSFVVGMRNAKTGEK